MNSPTRNLRMLLAALLAMVLVLAHTPVRAESTPDSSAVMAENQQTVNINQASLNELQALKGIGPAKAKRIVSFREENGPFKSVEALTQVKGISLRTLQDNQGRIGI